MGNQSNQNMILMYVSTDVYRSGRPRPTAINCILHVFCLDCLLKSRTYYGMRCGKIRGIMTCLILTRVVINQLSVPWKAVILEIFFIESTSEFQTSVTFLLANENIKCGYSFS